MPAPTATISNQPASTNRAAHDKTQLGYDWWRRRRPRCGPASRISAALDGLYEFRAGALDVDAEKGKAYAQKLGIAADRAYSDWKEMLAGEKNRKDKIDLVTVATPIQPTTQLPRPFLKRASMCCAKSLHDGDR